MVKILADSTCDLSPSLISRYKIGIIPLYVHLGEKEYKDGVDITPSDLYKWSDEHNETPRTSAPGIEDIESPPALKTSSHFWIKTAPMNM